MKYRSILLLFITTFISACTPKITENLEEAIPAVVQIEERTLDELVIVAPRKVEYTLPLYNAAATRTNDLLHTKLDIRFDFAKQHVLGKAILDFEPYFYPTSTLVLDAKGFDLHNIILVGNDKKLTYEYKEDLIKIQLDKEYQPKERYSILIEYTAKPNERKIGGSAAITQDKGLYFINPTGKDGDKPTQIWTQGETESNSCWFPTIDKPNERCTQEITVTIRDDFKTLSNGILKSSTPNNDGTRSDYWVMDKPHAPYLFMLAIGDFEIVKDTWRGKELTYYMEKEYEQYAKRIFPYTPEMLTFYSDLFGYEYPWSKYAQIVVRDYVSGAMENTTGVIFGDFMNGTERELIDEKNNERIVAHELVHHWFGDLVTCESWSNLPLNESFANYGEYLWMEEKHGKEEADYHLMNELNGYLAQSRTKTHDLIYFDYKDKEQTFDAHSYNKGGAILHSLRNYLGDDAFFASLKHYLITNEYTAVEAHDLRLSFEKITGQDLNWFFNQWFFATGHPVLEVTEEYDTTTQKIRITIKQTQDPEQNEAIYQLPLAIDVYTSETPTRHKVMINQRKQVFEFDAATAPKLVNVDADKILVGRIKHEKSETQSIYQYQNAKNYKSRYEALTILEPKEDVEANEAVAKVFDNALNDSHWYLRAKAIQSARLSDKIADLAVNDAHSAVRTEAINKLGESGDATYLATLKQAIEKDLAYPVIASGLKSLANLDAAAAKPYAEKMEEDENETILAAVGDVYGATKDLSKMTYFENTWTKIGGFQVSSFLKNYDALLAISDDTIKMAAVDKLKATAMDEEAASLWQRYVCARSINSLKVYFAQGAADEDNPNKAAFEANLAKITEILTAVIDNETNSQLTNIYANWK
ncbi:MAG: aminopeptidase N [Cognaticolwellia sp.]|jgi:aminopeptidase N